MDLEGKISRHCWSAEGLWGDSTCPELERYVHCQRCPVYGAAGRKLFGRTIPDEYLLTSGFNAAKGGDSEDGGLPLFVFKCADSLYAFPSSAVSEVSRARMVHRLPHRLDAAIEGIVNINGELVTAVGILRVLGVSSDSVGAENSVLVVCRRGDDRFAFGADAVLGVRRVSPDAGAEPADGDSRFVEKIYSEGDLKISLIDFELLSEAIAKRKI